MQEPGSAAPAAAQPHAAQKLVFRNALRLLLTQAAGMPLSMVVTAVMARHIGSEEFGLLYLTTMFSSFGFLAVDWGQGGAVPAMVAKDRTQAGTILGTSFAWRVASSATVYLVLAAACLVLGYQREFQIALALAVLNAAVNTITGCHLDIFKGFERTDIIGYSTLGGQITRAVIVIPTLLLGGKLRAVLLAEAVCSAAVLAVVWRTVRAEAGKVHFRLDVMKKLLVQGSPFLIFGIAMALQPNVDGVFLSKLASPESVGWYAAARKLIGVLVFPANALITALYPTLCRLHAEDMDGFRRTTTSALRLTTVLVVPVALGCALYPDIGIRIFSKDSFGPAANDLRVLALFLFLVYFTMPLGISVLAAGRQRAWAAIQFGCVLVSASFDPFLIPYFQKRFDNGGLGVCFTTVASETLMLAAGLTLVPRGVFNRAFARQMALALLAGVAMSAVAWITKGISPFVSAPIAVAAYLGCLVVTGGIDKEQVQTFRAMLGRKMAR